MAARAIRICLKSQIVGCESIVFLLSFRVVFPHGEDYMQQNLRGIHVAVDERSSRNFLARAPGTESMTRTASGAVSHGCIGRSSM